MWHRVCIFFSTLINQMLRYAHQYDAVGDESSRHVFLPLLNSACSEGAGKRNVRRLGKGWKPSVKPPTVKFHQPWIKGIPFLAHFSMSRNALSFSPSDQTFVCIGMVGETDKGQGVKMEQSQISALYSLDSIIAPPPFPTILVWSSSTYPVWDLPGAQLVSRIHVGRDAKEVNISVGCQCSLRGMIDSHGQGSSFHLLIWWTLIK